MCFLLRVMATRLCEWRSAWKIDVDKKKVVTAHETFNKSVISTSLKKDTVLKRENEQALVHWVELGVIHWIDSEGCKRDQNRMTLGLNVSVNRHKKDDPFGLGVKSKEKEINVRLHFDECCLEAPDFAKLHIDGAQLCSSFANDKEGMERIPLLLGFPKSAAAFPCALTKL